MTLKARPLPAALASSTAVPLAMQISVFGLERQQSMAQVLGPVNPSRRPGRSSGGFGPDQLQPLHPCGGEDQQMEVFSVSPSHSVTLFFK